MKFGVELSQTEAISFIKSIGLTVAYPSFEALSKIILAVLGRIPFQNINMLLREKKSPTIAQIKADMLSLKGGPCGHINPFLGALLEKLGYDISLVSGSMMRPNCHLGLLLTYDKKQYYIDCGDGKPYFQPIPIREYSHYKGLTHEWRSSLKQNQFVIEYKKKEGEWFTNCTVSLQKVNFNFFEKEIHYHYTQDDYGPFQRGLRFAIYPNQEIRSLRDNTFTYVNQNRLIKENINSYRQLKKIYSNFLVKHINFDKLVAAYQSLIDQKYINKKILS